MEIPPKLAAHLPPIVSLTPDSTSEFSSKARSIGADSRQSEVNHILPVSVMVRFLFTYTAIVCSFLVSAIQ